MESESTQYEGGDVLIKPPWHSPDFLLVHRFFLYERWWRYFRALLADRWTKPQLLGSEVGAPQRTLYLATNTKNPKLATFILTPEVRNITIGCLCGFTIRPSVHSLLLFRSSSFSPNLQAKEAAGSNPSCTTTFIQAFSVTIGTEMCIELIATKNAHARVHHAPCVQSFPRVCASSKFSLTPSMASASNCRSR